MTNKNLIRYIYDPEHDIIADNVIPWYVITLLELIEKLEERIERLEDGEESSS